MNEETKIQRLIMLKLSEVGCLVWRNETGSAHVGKVIYKRGNQVTLDNAQMLPFGLCKGSSDIVGIAPDGRFLALEVKTATGRASKEQVNFIEQVKAKGGIAGIARSPYEALALLEGE